MKNKRLFEFSAAAVAVVAVALFAAAAFQASGPMPLTPLKPKPEKLCPITFHLDPVTSLQKNFATAIEKTNADLAKKLVEFRAILSHAKKEDLKSALVDFAGTCQRDFEGTYLKKPVLWGDDGKTYTGWGAITNYLGAIMPSTTYLSVQGVHVYLEYLPIKSEKYETFNRGIKDLGDLPNEIDFLASIRTVLAYASYDDPLEIGNESPIPHRKICDPIF